VDAVDGSNPNDEWLRSAYFEHVTIPPGETCLWRIDDYPWRRTVWNYHPELEIHLIRYSSGIVYVGDYIGEFQPGQLVLVGSNLPHNWITPSTGNRVLPKRDIVVQFREETISQAARHLPELAQLERLFQRATLGIEFFGAVARDGARIMNTMGETSGIGRLTRLLDLLTLLGSCEESEQRSLATKEFREDFTPGKTDELAALDEALEFIRNNYQSSPRMATVAQYVGLSESAFSRLFKSQTGSTFTDHVSSLRIWTARKLLVDSEMPITDICFRSGYQNISNFNRRFLAAVGMTPSQYRRAARKRSLPH